LKKPRTLKFLPWGEINLARNRKKNKIQKTNNPPMPGLKFGYRNGEEMKKWFDPG